MGASSQIRSLLSMSVRVIGIQLRVYYTAIVPIDQCANRILIISVYGPITFNDG